MLRSRKDIFSQNDASQQLRLSGTSYHFGKVISLDGYKYQYNFRLFLVHWAILFWNFLETSSSSYSGKLLNFLQSFLNFHLIMLLVGSDRMLRGVNRGMEVRRDP